MNPFILIIASVLLNGAAQLFLKAGMRATGPLEFSVQNILPVIRILAVNGYLYLGGICYLISIWIWLAVLKRVDVMVAYPFISVGFVLTTIFAWMFFHEPLTAGRVVGIGVIIAGVIILHRG